MAPTYSELVESLIDGARFDDAEDVQTALDQGVDVNAQDEQGRTGIFVIMLRALLRATLRGNKSSSQG